jgi:hypothetical protein
VKHGQINAYEGDIHQITMSKITYKKTKAVMVCIDSFKLQTITALIKSFCGGVQGGQFFQKAPPLAAGGNND